MASTFTTNLKFNKPALGDAGWGTAINGGFTDLADQAIAGVVDVDVTAGNVTLTSLSGAVDQARAMALRVFGGAVARNVVVPTTSKLYVVQNDCTAAIQVKTSVDPGALIPAGHSAIVRVDPTVPQVVFAMDYLQSLRLGFALDATYGGTGQSSYAVGDLLYAGTTTTLVKLAAVATGSVLRAKGVNTAPAWEQVVLTTDVTGVLPVANGGTGLSAPGALNNVLSSDGAGAWTSTALSTLVPDASDTTKGVVELATTAEVQTGTDTTRAITPAGLRGGALVLDAVQTVSAVAQVDFTPIPSWVKRITVMFAGVSTNGTNPIDIQIGDSGGIETTGYTGAQTNIIGGGTGGNNYSGDAFELRYVGTPYLVTGTFTLTLMDAATNLWIGVGVHGADTSIATTFFSAGRKALSSTLDRLRISAGGNNITGSINILYE
jgi:hypothetical protein